MCSGVGEYCFGVNQARAGFAIILKALGFSSGDEIILSAYNFHIMPEIIVKMGLKPVFVDIEESSFTLDPVLIENKISVKTKAILVTHMFGHSAEIDKIAEISRKYNLILIEDCAHALGTTYKGKSVGTWADVSLFSFGHGKLMPCCGGGMIAVKDGNLAEKIRTIIYPKNDVNIVFQTRVVFKTMLMKLLSSWPFFHLIIFPMNRLLTLFGTDIKAFEKEEFITDKFLDDIGAFPKNILPFQASMGLMQLPLLPKVVETMRKNQDYFMKGIKGCKYFIPLKDSMNEKAVFLYYNVIILHNLHKIRKFLMRYGIDTSWKSAMCDCASHDFFLRFAVDCPKSKKNEAKILEIPNNIYLDNDDLKYIIDCIKKADLIN